MRGRFFYLTAVAHALGVVLIAIAIMAAALELGTPHWPVGFCPVISAATDPRAEEPKQCQGATVPGKDNAACETVRDECHPLLPTNASAPELATEPKPSGR